MIQVDSHIIYFIYNIALILQIILTENIAPVQSRKSPQPHDSRKADIILLKPSKTPKLQNRRAPTRVLGF